MCTGKETWNLELVSITLKDCLLAGNGFLSGFSRGARLPRASGHSDPVPGSTGTQAFSGSSRDPKLIILAPISLFSRGGLSARAATAGFIDLNALILAPPMIINGSDTGDMLLV